jgi:hypothetical protein
MRSSGANGWPLRIPTAASCPRISGSPAPTGSCWTSSSIVSQYEKSLDGLAADPVAVGHLDHRESVPQDLHDGVEALLCHCELQEHAPDLLASTKVGEAERKVRRSCQPSTGTPEPISRYQHDKHQPDQHMSRQKPLPEICQKLRYAQPHVASQRNPRQRLPPARLCGHVGCCIAS